MEAPLTKVSFPGSEAVAFQDDEETQRKNQNSHHALVICPISVHLKSRLPIEPGIDQPTSKK